MQTLEILFITFFVLITNFEIFIDLKFLYYVSFISVYYVRLNFQFSILRLENLRKDFSEIFSCSNLNVWSKKLILLL